jgi:hypothetical protein
MERRRRRAFLKKILSVLKANAAKDGRNGEFESVLRELIGKGYLHKRRDAAEDYSERWKVLKELDLFGNRVLVVSNEKEGKFIGCCFDSRAEILMAATGDLEPLRHYAKTNGCQLFHDEKSDQESSIETLKKLKIKTTDAKFVELRCGASELFLVK